MQISRRECGAAAVLLTALLASLPLLAHPVGASTAPTGPVTITASASSSGASVGASASPSASSTATPSDVRSFAGSVGVAATDTATGTTDTTTGTTDNATGTTDTAAASGNAADTATAIRSPAASGSPADTGTAIRSPAEGISPAAGGSASSSATADPSARTPQLNVTTRYGCRDDGFVEVGVSRSKHYSSNADAAAAAAGQPTIYQVGLSDPSSTDSLGTFPENGPSLVAVNSKTTWVRLAGSVSAGEHVFIREVGQLPSQTVPLSPTCSTRHPMDFELAAPTLTVTQNGCAPGARAEVQARVVNNNDVSQVYQKLSGSSSVNFTVLLVRASDDKLMPPGKNQLLRFAHKGAVSVPLMAKATKPVTFEVRAIGVDGQSADPQPVTVDCSARTPSSSPPVPTVTPHRPTSSPATSASPTETPRPTPSTTTSRPAVTPPPTVLSPSVPVVPQGPVIAPDSFTGAPSSPAGSIKPSASATRTSTPPAPSPSSAKTSRPSVLEVLPAPVHSLAIWQSDAALVVLVDALAISALVSVTVWNARRR
jgi:hypothetical protein